MMETDSFVFGLDQRMRQIIKDLSVLLFLLSGYEKLQVLSPKVFLCLTDFVVPYCHSHNIITLCKYIKSRSHSHLNFQTFKLPLSLLNVTLRILASSLPLCFQESSQDYQSHRAFCL